MGKDRYAPSTRRFSEVEHAPCIYAAELSTGMIKVGAASSARARLMSLANEVRREHGAEIVRFHVVPKRTAKAAFEAESNLVALIRQRATATPGRREYFAGVAFDTACALANAAVCVPYVRGAAPAPKPA